MITTRPTILAQLALREFPSSMEAFWITISDYKIQRIFVILGEDEHDEKTLSEYFPDDFMEFDKIRVNNRKSIKREENLIDLNNTQLFYEIVAKDCAEAPFCMIEVCDFWEDANIPTHGYGRIAATTASVFESDIDADASLAIVSNYGAGRAGAFFAGALSIEKVKSGQLPNIGKIAHAVRFQRPGAIENISQYCFIFIMVLQYCHQHVEDVS